MLADNTEGEARSFVCFTEGVDYSVELQGSNFACHMFFLFDILSCILFLGKLLLI